MSERIGRRERAVFRALIDAILAPVGASPSSLSPHVAGKLLDDLLAQHGELRSDALRGLRKAADVAVIDAMDELARTDEPAWEAIRLVALAAFYQQPEVMHLLDHVEGTAHPPAPAGPPEWLLRPLLDPPEQGVESPAAKPASSNPES